MNISQGRSRKFSSPEAAELSSSPRQLFYLFDFELFASSVERIKDLIWATPRDLGFLVERYEKIRAALVLHLLKLWRVPER
jgi:hypothetical protein